MSDEQTYFIIEEILKGKVLTYFPIMGWKVEILEIAEETNASGLFLEQGA